MTTSLHPNLAKLAASYDEILERYGRGSLSAAAARMEIATLSARDDNGILWSISPDDGQWLRRTRSGELVPGDPPTYGLATPTPHDVSGSGMGFVPDSRIDHYEVTDEHFYNPGQFTGTTRKPRALTPPAGEVSRRVQLRSSRLVRVAAIALVLAIVLGVAETWRSHASSPTTPTSQVTQATH